MNNHNTLDDLRSQRATVLTALNIPGIPADEMEIYKGTLRKLDALIAQHMDTSNPGNQQTSQNVQQPKRVTFSQSGSNGESATKTRTVFAGGHAHTESPITSRIGPANNSDKFNPSITITWSDGYQVTVDETAATGRFKSTFRDTLGLKCVSERRFKKMWRWDTPWRASGFYQALISLRGEAPTLKDLGYAHPSALQREVFELLVQQRCVGMD